jgi:hypothetical protein
MVSEGGDKSSADSQFIIMLLLLELVSLPCVVLLCYYNIKGRRCFCVIVAWIRGWLEINPLAHLVLNGEVWKLP